MSATPSRAPARGSTRERVLDAAERCAVEKGGMARLRVGEVAAAAGVSRQTVYNEFGDKFGLAQAVVIRVAHRLLDVVEPEVVKHDSLPVAVEAGMALGLRSSREQPLVRLAVSRAEPGDMIALLTTDAGAVIDVICDRLVELVRRRWPAEHPDDVALGVVVVARLALSHLVCPTEPVEQFAHRVARVVDAIMTARRA